MTKTPEISARRTLIPVQARFFASVGYQSPKGSEGEKCWPPKPKLIEGMDGYESRQTSNKGADKRASIDVE